MYFPVLDAGNGDLLELRAVPMRMRRFRLERADADGDVLAAPDAAA